MFFKTILFEYLVMFGVFLLGLGEGKLIYFRLLFFVLRGRNKIPDVYCRTASQYGDHLLLLGSKRGSLRNFKKKTPLTCGARASVFLYDHVSATKPFVGFSRYMACEFVNIYSVSHTLLKGVHYFIRVLSIFFALCQASAAK